jgi:hypothetical protein
MSWRLNLSRWDWREEGFQLPPTRLTLSRRTVLYRVWGGMSSEAGNPQRPGVCLSFEAPTTRREAEGLFSVFEWGNSCRFVTAFEVASGATVYIGRAHPGDYFQSALGAPGSQVFIETAQMQRCARRFGAAVELIDDMGSHAVIPNRDPGKERSS